MNKERENTQIIKEAYDLWHETKGASVDHFLNIMSDPIDFRSLVDGQGGLKFTETAHSHEDMERYFEGLAASMEMLHFMIQSYIAQDDKVVVVSTTKWRVRENGKEFETPKVDVIELKDGKIVSFFEFYDTAKIQAAVQS